MKSKRSQENANPSQAKRMKLTQSITPTKSDRPGKINKIHLKNFMCHSSLQVDFNKNINFVIGRNGSGKSAILTALILVLGGRASNTNRSNSMKEFIKKGCISSTIDIEISNVGPFPYKKDIFGKSIVISRQFKATGGSQYKIKSDTGAVISTKKNDLLKIVSHLKIMIDNPLSVLTQDTARTFLNSSDPKKRYIFFAKATSLDYIKEKIQHILAVVKKGNEKMEKIKTDHEELKLKIEETRKQLEKCKSIDSLEQAKKIIETEIIWSNALTIENEKSSVVSQLEEILNEIEEMKNKIAEESDNRKNLDAKIRTLTDSLKEKQCETDNLSSLYKDLKTKCKTQKDLYQEKADSIKQNTNALVKIKNSQKVIMQEIDAIGKQLGMWQELRAEKEQKINSLLEREKELRDLKIVTEMESSTYFGNKAKHQDEMERLTGKLNQSNGKISQTSSVLRMLSNQTNNALSLYGAHIPELLEYIKREEKKFTELPIGPIGNYIKVNNKDWAGVIEKTLGVGFLKGFCVTNAKDGQTLVNIIKSRFPNVSLPIRITSKFIHKVHNISSTKAVSDKQNGILNFYDSLTISDPIIANCLIDQHSIERLLLFESEDIAMKFMSQTNLVPKNCRMAILKDGTIYYPVPNYRMYHGESKTSHLLGINIKGRQMQLQQELEEHKEELARIQSAFKEAKEQNDSCENKVLKLNKKIKEYDNELFQIQNNLRELKNQEEPSEGNLSLLKEEYEALTKKECDIKKSVTEMEDEMRALKCCVDEYTENLNKAKADVRECEEACLVIQDKIDQLEQRRQTKTKIETLEKNIKIAEQKSKEIQNKIGNLEQKLIQTISNVDESTKPSHIRSLDYLNEQLQQIKSSIRSVTSCGLDPLILQREYEAKSNKLAEDKTILETFDRALKELTVAVNIRYKLFLKLRMHMTSQVQQYFGFMLRMRKYSGIININHEDKTLVIEIDTQSQTAHNDENNLTQKNKKNFRDLRTLSGGERSYSTVSFLVALWNCMNLPFYFLDEFDVFMDHINRKVVMDVLIQSANTNLHKQYVFLTPQDTSAITASDTLKIHRMADPER